MKSFWEGYKQENPTKAAEIEILGLDFSNLPDKEVKEKVFALETTAIDTNCSISELKQIVLQQWEGKIEEGDYLYLIEYYDKKTFAEAEKYDIERTNTIWMMVEGWILEKVQEIERKYAYLPPRSNKDPKTLLIQFSLENSNEFSIQRKMHIYLKNFPMTTDFREYVTIIETIFDRHIESYIIPLADSKKENISLYNMAIRMQIIMACDEIKTKYKELIEECNDHDVSFYAELDIAQDRAFSKYLR